MHNLPKSRLANRDLTGPYQWIDVEPASVKVRTLTKHDRLTPAEVFWTALVTFVVIAVAGYAIDGCAATAHAEPLPSTMTVQCKDGVTAHDVIGDFQAPCRKHGGTVAVAEGGKPGEPDFVPVGTDEGDFKLVAACSDGSEYWSNKASKRGACDGHGGVKSYADGSPVRHKTIKAYRKGESK